MPKMFDWLMLWMQINMVPVFAVKANHEGGMWWAGVAFGLYITHIAIKRICA